MIPGQFSKCAARGIETLLVLLHQALQHCNMIIAEDSGGLRIEFPVFPLREPDHTGISPPFVEAKATM